MAISSLRGWTCASRSNLKALGRFKLNGKKLKLKAKTAYIACMKDSKEVKFKKT